MKKRIWLFVLPFLLAACVHAVEIDTENSGIIDSYSGKMATESAEVSEEDNLPRLVLSGTMLYDREEREFVYPLENGTEITSTAADGMVLNGSVSITVPFGVNFTLYRNGEPVNAANLESVSDVGSYVLSVQQNSGQTVELLRFTIVGRVVGSMPEYRAPAGCAVTEVLLDGEPVTGDPYTVDLTREGYYEIRTCLLHTDRVFELRMDVDHTAPVLKLENVVDGVAKGPVDLSDLEEDAELTIWRNGELYKTTKLLTESGNYTLEAEDPAGNLSRYQFVLTVYLNVSAWVFVVLLAAVIGGIVLFMTMSGKRLRIR